MPTYDYKCNACKYNIEINHSMNDKQEIICPTCLKPMQKGFGGGIGIQFKGSGFYQTDYKKS